MRDKRYKRPVSILSIGIRNTNHGFTLVEILIVVGILGILAAIVLPEYHGYTQKAKESAAKESLQILRSAIERYAVQHDGIPPGYASDNPSYPANFGTFTITMARGNYLSALPKNPFNDSIVLLVIANDESFPAAATGEYGWIYKPQTKTIKLDWPGTDQNGNSYFDY